MESDANLSLKCKAATPEDFCNLEMVNEALKVTSCYQIKGTAEQIMSSKKSVQEMTNHFVAIDLGQMANLHMKYVGFQLIAKRHVEFKDPNLRAHFENLSILAGLTFLREFKKSTFDSGYLTSGQGDLIDEAFKLMLAKIRPYAIPLAELFNIPDDVLQSAIGNSYGDIYET